MKKEITIMPVLGMFIAFLDAVSYALSSTPTILTSSFQWLWWVIALGWILAIIDFIKT